jgi:hypothetical protein
LIIPHLSASLWEIFGERTLFAEGLGLAEGLAYGDKKGVVFIVQPHVPFQ